MFWLPILVSACALDTGEDLDETVTTDKLAANCVQSPYNCAPPASDNRDGPRVIYSKTTNSLDWPVFAGTPIFDGIGDPTGTVVPKPNTSGSTVEINYGQRKSLGGQTVVYAWSSHTASGAVSGWIPEAKVQNTSLLDTRDPTINLPDPGQGDYDAIWLITGGNPASIAGLKVSPNVAAGAGENGTDYLVRPGNIVNLTFNVPGFHLGGYSVDSVPVGSIFRRALGVQEIDIPLYHPDSSAQAGVTMHFIYGYIFDGAHKRFGWMAKEAMRDDGTDGGAGSWSELPGSAVDIASGTHTWCLGTNSVPGGHSVFHWNGSTWNFITGGGVRIAVDSNQGNVWIVNDADNIFVWNGSAWSVLPGWGIDIAVGGGQAWLIGANAVPGGYGIYHWNGGGWDAVPGGAVRVAVDGAGRAWVVNNAGNIFYWNGSGFAGVPGLARDIGAYGNQIWIVGTNPVLGGHGVYHWNGSGWDMVNGGAEQISVDALGHPIVVNNAGHMFRRR